MTQQEVIKTFVKALDDTQLSGRAALDEAVKACTNLGSYKELVDQFKADVEACGDNYQRFLIEKCGIILDNDDTGAITGADAGGDSVITDDNILPADGDPVYPEGSEFTIDGLTIYGIPDRSELTGAQQTIVHSWWLDGSIDLINQSYGFTFNEEGTGNHRMRLMFEDVDEVWKAAVQYTTAEDPTDGDTAPSSFVASILRAIVDR